jgi:hypothetical protein
MLQLVAPEKTRSINSGHIGRDRTVDAIYLLGMSDHIARWVRQCETYAKCKLGPGKGKALIKQIKAYRPMEILSVDILGALPFTNQNNEYVIVCGCYFAKWKMAFAVPNHTAYTVADTLITHVFLQYGFPTQIHTDQGKEFESHLFLEICKLLDVDKTRTCPYNPKSNGMIERNNRTILQMLTHFVSVEQNQKDWGDHLCYIMAVYRVTQHSSTGCSLNLLMLGREVDNPIDLMVGPPPGQPENECTIEYVKWVKSTMRQSYSFAYEKYIQRYSCK